MAAEFDQISISLFCLLINLTISSSEIGNDWAVCGCDSNITSSKYEVLNQKLFRVEVCLFINL